MSIYPKCKFFLKKNFLILFFLSCVLFVRPAQSESIQMYNIQKPAPWITPQLFDSIRQHIEPFEADEYADGTRFWIVDEQIKKTKTDTEHFIHFTQEVLNHSGVERAGNISIDFDPAYQTLILHHLTLSRDEEMIDALSGSKVSLLQREKDLAQSILDERKTLNIIVPDVRVGDILDYSFTITGENPLFDGRLAQALEINWSVPVHFVSYRLLIPPGRRLNIDYHNSTAQPAITLHGAFHEYLWTFRQVAPVEEEEGMPSWYNPYAYIYIVEWQNWRELNQWSKNLYDKQMVTTPELTKIINGIKDTSGSKEDQILNALRFVQKEIRYTSVKNGEPPFKPEKTPVILERRYGDCKDKALLLTQILRGLGHEAYPSIVDSYLRAHLSDYVPSPYVFNHVITQVRFENEIYWLDATLNYQPGDLKHIYQTRYGQALVMDGVSGLTPAPLEPYQEPRMIIQQEIDFGNDLTSAPLLNHTMTLKGKHSDYMLYRFATQTGKQIQKDFLNYHREMFENITVTKKLRREEDPRKNTITIFQYYQLPDVWGEKEDDKHMIELYPIDIYYNMSIIENVERKTPFAVIHPVHITSSFKIKLPKKWRMDEGNIEIKNEAFIFTRQVQTSGQTILVRYTYQTLKDHILAKDIKKYHADIKRVRNNFKTYIDADNITLMPGKDDISLAAVTFSCALILILSVSAGLLYRRSPPVKQALQNQPPLEIKGVLDFAALIIALIPLVLAVCFVNQLPFYSRSTWDMMQNKATIFYQPLWAFFAYFSLTFYWTSLIGSGLQCFLFFQRKKSFPALSISCSSCLGIFMLTRTVLSVHVYSLPLNIILTYTILTAIGLCLLMCWCVYLWKSKRVKNTFVFPVDQPPQMAE